MAVGRSRQPCHMVSHSGKTVDCNNFLFQLIDTIVIKYSSSLIESFYYFCDGEMAEWSIAAVLKTVDCNRSGGSNPSFSAKEKMPP